MGEHTKIAWTDRTWNPVSGCTKVSEGCDHCYAESIAERFRGGPAYPNGFELTLKPDKLTDPLRWTRSGRVFVNSMSDLFHADVPDSFIAAVFAVMAAAKRHQFQVLTKRHARMRALLSSAHFQDLLAEKVLLDVPKQHRPSHIGWPLPNVWLGVSVENQKWADIRIPALLDTPAAIRFVSAEPLLGPVDLSTYLDRRAVAELPAPAPSGDLFQQVRQLVGRHPLDWVIVGGESGPRARPMHPDWARSLRDQCEAAGAAFCFKQWGAWAPAASGAVDHCGTSSSGPRTRAAAYLASDGERHDAHDLARLQAPEDWALLGKVGAKTAGRTLDGQVWDQFPDDVR